MKRIKACIAIIIAITILSCNQQNASKETESIKVNDLTLTDEKNKTEELADTAVSKFTPTQQDETGQLLKPLYIVS